MSIQSGASEKDVLVTTLDITGGASSANVFAYKGNPWGIPVIITRALLRVTTIATAAATLDIGVGATSATADDTLLDGKDVNAATGIFDNMNDTDNGTNGLLLKYWAADTFVTVKEASGNVDGLVAHLILICVPAT
jgi:hypothetical protein